jgi:hypothetical protein
LATTQRVNFAVHFRHRSSPDPGRRAALGHRGPRSRAGTPRAPHPFRRQFSLPAHVGAEHVEADYDRGLLRIRVWDEARPEAEPRKIAIRADRPAIAEATE